MNGSKSVARVNGVELEYVTIDGDPSAPTLVFLHEGLGSVDAWRDFPLRLRNETGCAGLVYSRYGNGFSSILSEPRPVSYMHDEASKTLPALLEMLAVTDAVLVGHSDGASIAILCAAAGNERVRGLLLEAPHVFVEELSIRSIAGIRTTYQRDSLRERLARYHADPDATFYGWNDIWLSPAFASWNIEAPVERIAVPTLVIQGRDDLYGTIAQVESIVRRHPETDTLLLANCGHAPHREREGFVTGAAAQWIKERFAGYLAGGTVSDEGRGSKWSSPAS
ncbi:MAG TPA: alpha/beta hydrolase [Candidatus Tumulicola sp.]